MLHRLAARSNANSGGRTAAENADVPESLSARPLPLEAAVDAHAGGWSVRLPVRAEHVTVTKESIALEEVRVLRAVHQEPETVHASVRSEQLNVDDDTTRR